MREHFLVILLYFPYISFRIPVSYPKERVGLLGANFLPPKSGYYRENQPVLGVAINEHV